MKIKTETAILTGYKDVHTVSIHLDNDDIKYIDDIDISVNSNTRDDALLKAIKVCDEFTATISKLRDGLTKLRIIEQ